MSSRPSSDFQRQKLKVLLQQADTAIVSNLINPCILCLLLRNVQSRTHLVIWLVSILGLNALRVPFNARLRARLAANSSAAACHAVYRHFLASVILSGVTWAYAGTILLPHSIVHQALTAFVFAGITAGALSTYSILPSVALSYHAIVLVPFVIRLLLESTPINYGMAGMTALYALLLGRTVLQFGAYLHQSISLQWRLVDATRLATVGEVASNLAHEINNPMAIVLGRLQQMRMLEGEGRVPPQMTTWLNSMEIGLDRIYHTVRSLLVFHEREQLLSTRAISVQEAYRSALRLFQAKYVSSEIRNEVSFPDAELQVRADPALLSQVFCVLLQNAYEAIVQAGRGQGWIRTNVFLENRRVIIEISDDGVGIPLPMREKIFEPFFTTKQGAGEAGTGLGLTIARKITERLEGSLELKQEVANTTFRVVLPLAPSSSLPTAA